jgi:hypothetical protein
MNTLEFNFQRLTTINVLAMPPEILVPNELAVQYLFGGKVLAFKAHTTSRPAMDAWIERIKKHKQISPDTEVIYTLHDFSERGCHMTPYARHKLSEIRKDRSVQRSYAATVMQKNATGVLAQAVARLLNQPKNQVKLAFSLDEALLWLQKGIQQNAPVVELTAKNHNVEHFE